ncbi:MAG: CRISPR-associated endoribonuclease Cas6 [Balneolaceae bacterium]
MRIALTIAPQFGNRTLPINYQYEISAWIYKMIHHGDAGFAEWLHNKGYTKGNKQFKLFSFSNLEVEQFKVFKDRFKIVSDKAKLYLTFHIDDAVQHFITGLFQNSSFSIGDRKSRVDFDVQSVEMLASPDFTDSMKFKALSPVCVTRPVEMNGKLGAEYLAPEHPEYERRFFENLVTRYQTVYPEANGRYEERKDFKLKITTKPKSRLIKVKADTPQETQIRGYMYDFECHAPAELLKFGYEAGFAEKNALGFGYVEVVENEEVQNGSIK